MRISTDKDSGFTFLEVIVVLIIMGITTTLAISRFTSSNIDLLAQSEVMKTHLRYAQSRAMNASVIWGICSNGSSYWLFRDGNTANKVTLPGADSDTVNPPLDSMDVFIVSFDSWGIPYTDAGATVELTPGDAEITLSAGGETQKITITPQTGFIP